MLRITLTAILLAATVTTASAMDKKRVDKFCVAAKAKGQELKDCIARERKAGIEIDQIWAAVKVKELKSVLGHCRSEFSQSYYLELFCIQQETKYLRGMATIKQIPRFDTVAYCARVADAGGGSYQIEETCRQLEEDAQKTLIWAEVPLKIMAYCSGVAKAGGGSYAILATCADQEIAAKQRLQ